MATAQAPRTPLRDVSNDKPVLDMRIRALRKEAIGVSFAPQIKGKSVVLACSPVLGKILSRSPMQGRTPEDMRRDARRPRILEDRAAPFMLQEPCRTSPGPKKVLSVSPLKGEEGPGEGAPSATGQAGELPEEGGHITTLDASKEASLEASPGVSAAPPPSVAAVRPQSMAPTPSPPKIELPTAASSELRAPRSFAPGEEPQQVLPVPPAALALPLPRVVLTLEELEREKVRAELRAKREAANDRKTQKEAELAERERKQAEQEHAARERGTRAVAEALNLVQSDEVRYEDLAAEGEVAWELVSAVQCIALMGERCHLPPLSLAQLDAALHLRGKHTHDLNDGWQLLGDLHLQLIHLADGKKGKWVASKKRESQWTQIVEDEIEGDDDEAYEHWDYESRVQVLNSMCMRALEARTDVLAADPDAMRMKPVGLDRDGRAYWHLQTTLPNAWVLRDEVKEARSRASDMSEGATPERPTQPKTSQATVSWTLDAEEAPERGEAGENYYWHKHWTAVCAKTSKPAPAPVLQCVCSSEEGLLRMIKALSSGQSQDEDELAAYLAVNVLAPVQAHSAIEKRKVSLRVARRRCPHSP